MSLLFYILIFAYLFYLASRYLFPYLLKRYLRKVHQQYADKQSQNHKHKEEGEVSVNFIPPESQNNKFKPEDAQEVEFEEIKKQKPSNT